MIITISRQFGSGGREIGKRLSEALGYEYFDKELITKVAEDTGFHEDYIEENSESIFNRFYPYTFGRSFVSYQQLPTDTIHIAQNKILKEIAKKDNCVIIGRSADVILMDYNPFKVFIYASDMNFKVERCYDKVPEDKTKSLKEMQKEIQRIDKERSKYYEHYTGQKWGVVSNYNLCIDVSVIGVKKAVEILVSLINK